MRLNKYMAINNISSRREADNLIKDGAVLVNGEIERNPGRKIDPENEKVSYAFDVSELESQRTYIALNKPTGYVVSTNEEEGKPVYDLVKHEKGLAPIGRLDKDSSGLLLFTNDSSLPKKIIGEESHCEKEYYVKVVGQIPDGALEKLRTGISLWGVKTKSAAVKRRGPNSFLITLVEGKNRQIRRMCQKVGYPVVQLKRIRIHTINLDDIKLGEWRDLTKEEIQSLKSL
ncbi:MAG: rRNA pseudouridine synthase [Candidatus Margulisiibacteriota bacterium]|nr:MAG: pseudouridylate synthase [Candidatus Margulisbacteria bacterium GWD2_39_127]OGI02991.1 MAG: pseudouridylate synthase [Candidatus Margulisbacteria bacterium GWF2_38_17]OGI09466.1 MAG: pseudouridylate synthase [Candidatus Margulisbacteria bacterium GWE2_39_32]PZM78788.1 MAG: rRNA pseudouridine synthase [Candidatus Margulisiibacteriota bacterium]HAR63327.1 rRNA pseudouridine synthase [Candidatus Margulisiibacteriota bacterium]